MPAQQKVIAEIQRIYNAGPGIFQSWKGGVAQNMGSPEYESMYLFPGSADPRIKQKKDARPPVYYYEALIAEGKSLVEIKVVLNNWQRMLGDSAITAISIKQGPSIPDEKGLITPTYTVSIGPGKKGTDAPKFDAAFLIHLDYEQRDDEELYSAIIQIGYL